MKKLLLASTALVATAGFAAADVALSGFAEMGIKRSSFVDDAEFHTDLGVTFTLSGETDNGISFGGRIALEEADGGIVTDTEDDFAVFVSSGGATLTMGDTDGAFDWAMTEVDIGGSIADDHTAHAGFSGNGGSVDVDRPTAAADPIYFDAGAGVVVQGPGFTPAAGDILIQEATAAEDGELGLGMGLDGGLDGQIARFDYAFEGFAVALSAEIDDAANLDPIWGIGGTYTAELAGLDLGVGLGYQSQVDNGSVWGISLDTTFDNGITAILNYSQFTEDGGALPDHNHFGIGLGYSMNALLVSFNYGVYTLDEDTAGLGDSGEQFASGWGFAANYDLGGGLVAQFGYGASTFGSDVSDTVGIDENTDSFSLGLAMSF